MTYSVLTRLADTGYDSPAGADIVLYNISFIPATPRFGNGRNIGRRRGCIRIKIRPDCLCTDFDTSICLDLKSTEDASAEAFARSSVNYDYDLQAAVYLEGLRIVFGRDFDFCFLAFEKTDPYGVALYGAPEEMVVRGYRRFRQALGILMECSETGCWPGYQPDGDYEILEWPRYAK